MSSCESCEPRPVDGLVVVAGEPFAACAGCTLIASTPAACNPAAPAVSTVGVEASNETLRASVKAGRP